MSGEVFEEKSVLNYITEPEAGTPGSQWGSPWKNNLERKWAKSGRSWDGLACLGGWGTSRALGFLSCSLFCTAAL